MDKQGVIQAIREVVKGFPFVLGAELFGSLARGEAGAQSDVDLVVQYAEGTDFLQEAALGNALEEALGGSVSLVDSLVVDSPRDPVQARFSRRIATDRELVYERLS